MIIIDLLGPLEADRMKVLFAPQNLKVRSLTTSFYKFRIPLEPTHDKSIVKALSIKPAPGVTAEKILVGLLWNVCFGKKFKVVHWTILFNVLIRTMNLDKSSEAIIAILRIVTAHAGRTSKWNSCMKPLKTIIYQKLEDREQQKVVLMKILKDLPVRLPEKGPKIEDLLIINFESKIFQTKPPDAKRIGVGYKDKGSLNSGSIIDPIPNSDFCEDKDEIFVRLLRQSEKTYKNLM
jgi:hypothetical protein